MNRNTVGNFTPALSTHQWRRHRWNSLIHKCGRTIVFHGSDPTASRDRMLRELNALPRPKPDRLLPGSGWIDQELAREKVRRRHGRRKYRLVVQRRKSENSGQFGTRP